MGGSITILGEAEMGSVFTIHLSIKFKEGYE